MYIIEETATTYYNKKQGRLSEPSLKHMAVSKKPPEPFISRQLHGSYSILEMNSNVGRWCHRVNDFISDEYGCIHDISSEAEHIIKATGKTRLNLHAKHRTHLIAEKTESKFAPN